MTDELTRRAVIAAHDAECNPQCGEDATTYRKLTTVEQAIVELWRADLERALQDERERAACDLDTMQAAYSGEAEVQRGLRIGAILIRKIAEATDGKP